MNNTKRWTVWGMVALCLALGACATSTEPFTYTPANELKPGPGLFSGEDGVFTLYGKPAPSRAESADDRPHAEDLGTGPKKAP